MKETTIQRSKTAKEQREEKQEGSKDGMDQSKSNKRVGGPETWRDKQWEPADTTCEKGRKGGEGKGREGKEKAGQPESFASQPGEGGLPGQSSQLTSYKGGPESQLVESSQTGQAIQERNPRSEQRGSSPGCGRQRGDLRQAPRSAGAKAISSAHLHVLRCKKVPKNVTATR